MDELTILFFDSLFFSVGNLISKYFGESHFAQMCIFDTIAYHWLNHTRFQVTYISSFHRRLIVIYSICNWGFCSLSRICDTKIEWWLLLYLKHVKIHNRSFWQFKILDRILLKKYYEKTKIYMDEFSKIKNFIPMFFFKLVICINF